MRKIISCIIAVLMLGTVFTACSAKTEKEEEKKEKLSIVTTIFPAYDWAKEITKGNDNVEITMLLDNGVDLHSFQPSADDIIKISTCDFFIYVGGESDEWVDEALSEAVNTDMVVVNLLDALGDRVKEEELVEGMEGEEEEEEEEGEEEEGPEYDEHVWLSLKNASSLCQYISDELVKIDADNAETYKANTSKFIDSLESLDKKYQDLVSKSDVDTVLFGDRFPFRYLVDDYGLNYYAAFVGCSAESEASFETIVFLSNKLDELGLAYVFQIESADGSISQTIIDNTETKDQTVLTLDSMQSVTSSDVAKGVTYLSIMESNYNVLATALG